MADIELDRRLRIIRLIGQDELLVPGDNSFQNVYIRAVGGIPPMFGKKEQSVNITPEEWRNFDPQAIYVCGKGDLPEIYCIKM